MPLFEYRCKACGKRTENLVLAGDAADYVPECAHCGSHDLSRLLSTFAAHGEHKSEGSFDAPCGGSCDPAGPGGCGLGECGPGGCGMSGGGFGFD